MKLLGIRYKRGVESLGRGDINGPAKVAAAWDQTAASMKASFDDIATAMEEADNDVIWTDAVVKDTYESTTLNEFLKNNKTLDLDDEGLPDAIKAVKGDRTGVIQTYDIMQEAMHYQIKGLLKKSSGSFKTAGEQSKYNKAMDSHYASKMGEIVGTANEWKSIHLKDKAKAKFQGMVDALDEEKALVVAKANLDSGIWDQDTYNTETKELGATIDINRVDKAIRKANSVSELDAIEEELLSGDLRMPIEKRVALSNARDKRLEDFEVDQQKTYDSTFVKATEMYANGKLTPEWIKNQANAGKLDPDKLMQLYEKAETSKTQSLLKSDPYIVDDFKGAIVKIGRTDGETDTVKKAAKRQRDRLMNIYDSEESQLSGEDYSKLTKEIDAAESAALQNAPEYQRAIGVINTATGFSELMAGGAAKPWDDSSGITKEDRSDMNQAKMQANNAFKKALFDYMNHAGSSANVMEWVDKNTQRFSPETYKMDAEKRFKEIYPEYENTRWGGDPKNRMAGQNADKIVSDLGKRLKNGDLKSWEVKQALRMLGRGNFMELIQ